MLLVRRPGKHAMKYFHHMQPQDRRLSSWTGKASALLNKGGNIPFKSWAILVHFCGFASRPALMMDSTILNSGLSVELGSGRVLSFAYAVSAFWPSANRMAVGSHSAQTYVSVCSHE